MNQRVFGSFQSSFDIDGNLTDVFVVESPLSESCSVDCNYYQSTDEIISCNSWKRSMEVFFNLLEKTRDRLLGISNFEPTLSSDSLSGTSFIDSINWSIGAQDCCDVEPQLFNPQLTPISLFELSNPVLSCHPLSSVGCSNCV